MKKNPYARKRRQLSSLVKELQYYLSHQQENASIYFQRLIIKTKKLIQELVHVISQTELKRILGGVAIFLGMTVANQTTAQSFKPPVENPFGLVYNYYSVAAPAFVDIDGDGDMDLFEGGSYYDSIQYFENIGTAYEPQFAETQWNPFGLTPTLENMNLPAFVDIDNDGDMDVFVGENFYNTIEYYENIGTASDPQFAEPEIYPFNINPLICSYVIPSFADLDNDGDYDLLIGGYDIKTQYLENTGTAANPQFADPLENPFELSIDVEIAAPTFIDLDGDGDIDLLIGEYRGEGKILYFENTGTPDNPQFADPLDNPFGLLPTGRCSLIDYADLDHDTDLDLLIGDDYGNLQYFENTAATGISFIGQSPHIKLFPNPVNDILNIETESEIERIEVSNILGEKVLSIHSDLYKIQVKDLKPGIYTARIRMSDKNDTILKFIKK